MVVPVTKQKRLLAALLERHGQTYCNELDIRIERNTPAPLFQLLCASLLFSGRISATIATNAARALFNHGLTTPRKMADAAWKTRTRILNKSGYARFDESTPRMLADTATLLLEEYGGDLRRLREAAGQDPQHERELLKEFKGIGNVGADIICREAQAVWPWLYPFSDEFTLSASKRLGLPATVKNLANLTPKAQFPVLVAALVRMRLEKDIDDTRAAATDIDRKAA